MTRIAISLAGHTNNGKTTLTRTLLRTDVGFVDDRPHVTDIAAGHTLHKDQYAEIILWDLPGFGDSVRLKKRLQQNGLIGWLVASYDRWRDRPLWCSQQCLKNAKNDADVILYLIDSGVSPESGMDIRAELEVLGMIEKPVILLLNQTGLPDAERDQVLVQSWLDALNDLPFIQDAIPMDGWMRCWVQEGILFQKIATLLPLEKQEVYHRIIREWKTIHHDQVLKISIEIMAKALIETATDFEIIEKESLLDKTKGVLSNEQTPQSERARAALVEKLLKRSREMMEELLKANKLEGTPKDRVDSIIEGIKTTNPDAPPEAIALLSGIGSGLLTGLLADIKAGGMTFGGGAVAGALIGGLAAYALGRGYQKIKVKDGAARLKWSEVFLIDEWLASGMRYLMIAHFGRGQGQWNEPLTESMPQRWKQSIDQWMDSKKADIKKALTEGQSTQVEALLESMIRDVLNKLFPETAPTYSDD
jgi:predicted GTPase